MKDLKQFMFLLHRSYSNYCCCIGLANFGKKVEVEEYDYILTDDCKLIKKEDGSKYIKTKEKEIKIAENLTDEEKHTVINLLDSGTFKKLKLETWLKPNQNNGTTHFWRTGIADDSMQ